MAISNNFYELDYSAPKNRVFFKVKGEWKSINDVPNFEKDWMTITAPAARGFTICADLLEMKPFPPDVEKLNSAVQEKLMKKGCRKVGQIAPAAIAGAVNKMAKDSGLRDILRAFFTKEHAEKWLDE